MQLSSLSTSSYSSPNGRFKQRRAAVPAMAPVAAGPSSVRFPAESQYIPASFEASTVRVNNVAYLYKPMADLLGLIAESDARAFGGSPDAPRTPDFLGDLSWLFAPRDAAGASDAAAPAASASPGLRRAPFSSILAANAAYESSMDLADE